MAPAARTPRGLDPLPVTCERSWVTNRRIPVGLWVRSTAVSTLLTFCPPAPPERAVCISISAAFECYGGDGERRWLVGAAEPMERSSKMGTVQQMERSSPPGGSKPKARREGKQQGAGEQSGGQRAP